MQTRRSFRDVFFEMTSLVTGGRWCRNELKNLNGQFCMLGLVRQVGYQNSNLDPLVLLLDRAIPPKELDKLRGKG